MVESGSQALAFCRAIKCTCDVETINGQLIKIFSLGAFFLLLAFKSKKQFIKTIYMVALKIFL